MKGRRAWCVVSLLLAFVLGGLTVFAAITAPARGTLVVDMDPEAENTARGLMEALVQGNLETAGGYILGTPQFTVPDQSAQSAEGLLWQYYYDGLSYTLDGGLYPGNRGLSQNVTVTLPDLKAVTERMGVLAPEILTERIQAADSMEEVYDDQGGYRQDVTEGVILKAAKKAMEGPVETRQQTLTLGLCYVNGSWWVRPDQRLLDLLSGGLEKG